MKLVDKLIHVSLRDQFGCGKKIMISDTFFIESS